MPRVKGRKLKCKMNPDHVLIKGVCQSCGAPTKQNESIIAALEKRLMLGVSLPKATIQVGIAEQTIYNWMKKDEALRQRIRRASTFATDIARGSVLTHMKNDGNLALKYLERKEKDEFSPRSVVVTAPVSSTLDEDEREELKRLFQENDIDDSGLEGNFDD